jgi:hypothetical protein
MPNLKVFNGTGWVYPSVGQTGAVGATGVSGVTTRVATFTLNGVDPLTTSSRAKFIVPASMNGLNLTSCTFNLGTDGSAGASSSGSVTFSVQNGATNMLSTNPTATATNYTPTTAAVIDGAHDDIATGNIINIETVAAGTGVTYATILLEFA